ncbi:6-hydroxymethylpterin diphosphokinase MptE-like protein [Treponema sp.]|uniref:6-hydroxymethylpterin diphosphokinase MptE-like protein n=1 Tax=Treponema sp. TaxID=166 RepID=UPI00298EBBD1|nr:6-hydroxymethylpterin diphosphokinase MptE-like protein [Treponema sp.]MCR5612471.1 DUF115 domain-containing protein [Treponema sp.]
MIYNQIIKSKDNFDIPLFSDGRAMHSKYAPIKEAESFGSDINKENRFTIILGLGGGYHIESFAKKNPEQFILVIEHTNEDIEYLSSIECVQKLKSQKNVAVICKTQIKEAILKKYIPSFYGGINILSNRAWYNFDEASAKKIIEEIQNAINLCSKDFSVQSHFGFIWQKNILKNLKTVYKENTLSAPDNGAPSPLQIPHLAPALQTPPALQTALRQKKIAAIIAAGPSLDFTIKNIISSRENYFIIATDTAFSVIEKYKLNCDAVVSIDGQNISSNHFTGHDCKNTIFVFDMQANSNAVSFVKKIGAPVILTKSGHPLCEYAQKYGTDSTGVFSRLDSGAGTVTIAAIDFAHYAGFEKIQVFGADFAYIFEKPYAKGTYFDMLYRKNESKLVPAENLFTNLLYRTEIQKEILSLSGTTTNKITTEILNSYKTTFLEWIRANGYQYEYKDFIYYINLSENVSKIKSRLDSNFDTSCIPDIPCTPYMPEFNYEKFSQKIKDDIKTALARKKNISSIADLSDLEIALLPAVSYYRNQIKNICFDEALKLALSKILEYT